MRGWARIGYVAYAAAAWALCASVALADSALSHVVRPGETLASIASFYYGDPRRESVIVAENGLASEGGSAIVVGLRLSIPSVSYHKVVEGQTWAQLAETYYGDAQRAFVLIEANSASAGEPPDAGAELLVPYPLRHVVGQGETLQRLTKDYYPKGKSSTLRRFNQLKGNRLARGQIVLVPLSGLILTKEGRSARRKGAKAADDGGDVRDKQNAISAQLPALREHVKNGRYTDAVGMANRLIGGGDLTGNQIVTIQRELATALVALGREDLAQEAFKAMLAQQPDMELDIARSSPKVLSVFALARTEVKDTSKPKKSRKKARQRRKKTIKRQAKKKK